MVLELCSIIFPQEKKALSIIDEILQTGIVRLHFNLNTIQG